MDFEVPSESLRAHIRHALSRGKLPPTGGVKIAGGCGNATLCACCESTIPGGHVRLIIAISAAAPSLDHTLQMHPQCAQFWFDEAERRQLGLREVC